MNPKIYLVKKNPAASGKDVEWMQMGGKAFYAFLKSPAAKGRYFIRLTDDISYECPEIFIEASYEEYRRWKNEYDAHQYLRAVERDYDTVSADMSTTADSSLIDTVADNGMTVEEKVIKSVELHCLHLFLDQLPEKEKRKVKILFLSEKPMTIRAAAKLLGISKSEMARQKKALLKELRKKLGTNPE